MSESEINAALPLTPADIGRFFAPDHISDVTGWGRRWARNAVGRGSHRMVNGLVERTMNEAKRLIDTWSGPPTVASYKAPHAYRGTPKRPRFPRNTRRIAFFHV